VAFFSGWGAKAVSSHWTLTHYLQLVYLLFSLTGYLLQIPLLQVLGVTFGGLTGAKLLGLWRGVSLGLVTWAAIITPTTDALVQSVISVYLVGIYILGSTVAILFGA
jgi:Sec-independent protein secretion pathway component TatC